MNLSVRRNLQATCACSQYCTGVTHSGMEDEEESVSEPPRVLPCSSASGAHIQTVSLGSVQSEVSDKLEIRKGGKPKKRYSPVHDTQPPRLTFEQQGSYAAPESTEKYTTERAAIKEERMKQGKKKKKKKNYY